MRQTPSYSPSNVKSSLVKRPDSVANARVVQVSMNLLCVKRPVIGRQTSSYSSSNVQLFHVHSGGKENPVSTANGKQAVQDY